MTDVGPTLLARAAITDCMHRYCRALDRMDRLLMSTVFHPTATVRYPTLQGTWQEFVDYVWERHRSFDSHSHRMSSIIIAVDGGGTSATSESYVTASLWHSAGASAAAGRSAGTHTETRARYLDRWSLADGRWAIDHRVCIVDVMTAADAVGETGGGQRDRNDPSYA
jgi:hypothetical protein